MCGGWRQGCSAGRSPRWRWSAPAARVRGLPGWPQSAWRGYERGDIGGTDMAFLRATSAIDAEAEIHGREVFLRHPAMSDYSAWAELRAASRQHLTSWEPQWARDELTRSAYRRRLRQY